MTFATKYMHFLIEITRIVLYCLMQKTYILKVFAKALPKSGFDCKRTFETMPSAITNLDEKYNWCPDIYVKHQELWINTFLIY